MGEAHAIVLGQGISLVAAAMGLAAVSNNAQFWMLMVASLAQGAMFELIGPVGYNGGGTGGS